MVPTGSIKKYKLKKVGFEENMVSSMLRIEALKFIGLELRSVKASRQTGAVQMMEVSL